MTRRGGNAASLFMATVTVMVALTAEAEPILSSSPEPDAYLRISAPSGQMAIGGIGVVNIGTSTLQLTNCTVSAPFSVDPPNLTLAAGQGGSFGLQCLTDDTIHSGTLTCATNEPARATVSYPVFCEGFAVAQAIFRNGGESF